MRCCRLLDWAKAPGQKQATWTNHTQATSALNVIPDVPKGFRFNYDTYLPDVPSLVRPALFLAVRASMKTWNMRALDECTWA